MIRMNAEKLGAWNLNIVAGKAPEAMRELPKCRTEHPPSEAPKEILQRFCGLLTAKNPEIRVVINAITLETMTEAVTQFSRLGFRDVDIVQIFAAHGKTAGVSHDAGAEPCLYYQWTEVRINSDIMEETMEQRQIPRFMIAAAERQRKNHRYRGLLQALLNRGIRPASFKCGPVLFRLPPSLLLYVRIV